MTDELAGTWVNEDNPTVTTRMTINADDRFLIHDIPIQVFDSIFDANWNEPLDWNHLLDLDGTWRITSTGRTGYPAPGVDISPRSSFRGLDTSLSVTGSGRDIKLTYIYGESDDDNRFTFTRENSGSK